MLGLIFGKAPTSPLLAQDVRMWAGNIYYLIGLLICGSFCLVVLVALFTGLRIWRFKVRQNQSMAEYYRRTRRADGKMYPATVGGTCDHCRGVFRKLYLLKNSDKLCPACYEPHWRQAENWSGPPVPEKKEGWALRGLLKGALKKDSHDEEAKPD